MTLTLNEMFTPIKYFVCVCQSTEERDWFGQKKKKALCQSKARLKSASSFFKSQFSRCQNRSQSFND